MRSSLRRFLTGSLVMALILVLAVAGYVAAGWGVLESLYMVIITIAGVGYGEVRPVDTPELRLFTIFIIVAGITAGVYTFGAFIEMITEGEVRRIVGERRKSRDLGKLRNHVIVCGFGRLGQIVAQELHAAKLPFVVIETNDDAVHTADERGYLVLQADATQEEALAMAGIARATTVASLLDKDAANVFITLSARNLNPKLTIIARGEVPATEGKLLQAGADHVVLPSTIGGLRVAHLITKPPTHELIEDAAEISGVDTELETLGIRLHELEISGDLAGKSLGTVQFNGNAPFILVGLRRKDGRLLRMPPAETLLESGGHGAARGPTRRDAGCRSLTFTPAH